LALDRFADFVSDQVVVPVRETCAQCLGVVLQYCDFDTCSLVIEKGIFVLLDVKTEISAWEVRLAGLIGLKYFLAIRKDMVEKLLTKKKKSPVLEAIVHG
jgi:TATA-binding protein-associated factor